jgi:hypothetical protein
MPKASHSRPNPPLMSRMRFEAVTNMERGCKCATMDGRTAEINQSRPITRQKIP